MKWDNCLESYSPQPFLCHKNMKFVHFLVGQQRSINPHQARRKHISNWDASVLKKNILKIILR